MIALVLCSVVGSNAERRQATARTINVDAGLRHSASSALKQRPDVVESSDLGKSTESRRRRHRFDSDHSGECRAPAGLHRTAGHKLIRSRVHFTRRWEWHRRGWTASVQMASDVYYSERICLPLWSDMYPGSSRTCTTTVYVRTISELHNHGDIIWVS